MYSKAHYEQLGTGFIKICSLDLELFLYIIKALFYNFNCYKIYLLNASYVQNVLYISLNPYYKKQIINWMFRNKHLSDFCINNITLFFKIQAMVNYQNFNGKFNTTTNILTIYKKPNQFI